MATAALGRTLIVDFASPTKTSRDGKVKYRNAQMRDRDSGELIEVTAFGDTSNKLRGVVHGGTYKATHATVNPKKSDRARLEMKVTAATKFEQVSAPPDPRLAEQRCELGNLKNIPLACCSGTPPLVDVVAVVRKVEPLTAYGGGGDKQKRVLHIVDETSLKSTPLALMGAWANAFAEFATVQSTSKDGAPPPPKLPYVLDVRRAQLREFRGELQLTAWDNNCSVALFDPAQSDFSKGLVSDCIAVGVLDEDIVLAPLASDVGKSSEDDAAHAATTSESFAEVESNRVAKRART